MELKLSLKDIESRRFDLSKPPPSEVKVLTIQNKLILSRGNFAVISGLPKVGKSCFNTIIMASASCQSPICDINVHRYPDKKRVALFDTEQSDPNLWDCLERSKKMAATEHLGANFDVFTFREDNPAFILNFLEYYINENPDIGFIIIDGAIDLVEDFNNITECKQVVSFLKKITKLYDIAILLTLHTGRSTGDAIGHLGSATDKACQSTVEVIKDKDGIITLRPRLLRSAKWFNPVSIMRYDNGDIYQVDYVEPPEQPLARGKMKAVK